MVLATLSVQKTGMITLPKKWRDRNPATQVLVEDTPNGLLIRPISEIEYYEEPDGSFGLRFPLGMDMSRFLHEFQSARKRVEAKEDALKKNKKKRPQRSL